MLECKLHTGGNTCLSIRFLQESWEQSAVVTSVVYECKDACTIGNKLSNSIEDSKTLKFKLQQRVTRDQ